MGRKKQGYKAPEGLIRIPKSSCWYIKRTVLGKEVFKSTGTNDLIEAEEIYHIVMTELLKEAKAHFANRILGRSVSFSFVVERYLSEISPSKSKGGRNDKNSSKPLLRYFSESKIDGITKQDIYKYLDWRKDTVNERLKRKISGSTINREKSFLSEIFRKAIRWGYVNENPVIGIEGFSENKRERYITDEDFENILSKMEDANRDIFLAIYHTAQRPGRIYNFEWKQINIEERSILFENTSNNKKVPNILWINDALLEILLRLKSNRRTLSPYIFYKPSLKPYSEFDTLKIWKSACEKAKVEGTIPRDLRHKAISDMKRAGFNDALVGNVAGHSDPRTTKRYTHFSLEETRIPLQSLTRKKFVGLSS
jgi:integrase